MHTTVHALVLREVNYKDSDKILTLFTREEGKRTVKARGCRKKGSLLAAAAQLLVYSEMTMFELRGFTQVTEAESLNQFWGVRGELEKLALASYFAETAEVISEEGQPDEALLSLLLNTLFVLNKPQAARILIKSVYELRLMCLSGYAPMLRNCAVCGAGEPEAAQLNLSDGVLHCAHCRAQVGGSISLPLSPPALAAMRHVVYGAEKHCFSFTLAEPALSQMAQVCEAFLMTQLERGFHTLDFYKGL